MISNEDALMFLFRHPQIYKKCMDAADVFRFDPTEENEAKMRKEWETAKELYISEKLQQLDKAWSECLGVAVS